MAKEEEVIHDPKASRRKARKKRTTVTGRKKKEFTYRGYEVEELKAMPIWPPEDDPSAPSVVTLLSSRAEIYPPWTISRNEHFIDRVRRSTGRTSVHTAVTFQFYRIRRQENRSSQRTKLR